jgi:rRNA-processing protein FCF1
MKNKLVVSDTNIFLDLLSIDLLSTFFLLNYDFYTTDFIIAEIKNKTQKSRIQEFINNNKLIIKSFDYLETQELYLLFNIAKQGLSIEDCSVWQCAKNMQAHLLTGDSRLRKQVEKQGIIQVSGIIFIFDELIRENKISKQLAHEKLKKLMSINSRLPQKLCKERLTLWAH